MLLQKVSQQLERLAVEAAYKDAQIYSLQSQLEDLKGPKIRKRVAVDLNTKFANIDSIEQAIEEAEEKEAQIRTKELKLRPQRVSARKAKANMSNTT